MKAKHLVKISDISAADVEEILEVAADVKAHPERYATRLAGKTLAMIFMKSSTRTRVSFEVGVFQMGGHALYLGKDLQIGRGETVADTARVLSRYVHGVMIRTFAHKDVQDLAQYGSVPVINGLDDLVHPCQALADFQTIREVKGKLKGLKVTYVGDGNNVAHSLIATAARLGVDITCAVPKGYEPRRDMVDLARPEADRTGAKIVVTNDPAEGVKGADVIYTDVWVSMGQDDERKKRLADLAGYQVNLALFDRAKPDAIFMHCLPAHRGEEVTDDVCDHPRSVIFQQAENRLHAQKAVMSLLM